MKTRSIIILSILILAIALTAGVSFAVWSHNVEAKTSFTVSAENPKIFTCTITDSAVKLMPPKGNQAATESQREIILNVEGGACDIAIAMTVQAKKPNGVWISVPNDVLSAGIYDGANLITNITALSGEKTIYFKAKFIKDVELIDPIFKDAELRYTLTMTPTTV